MLLINVSVGRLAGVIRVCSCCPCWREREKVKEAVTITSTMKVAVFDMDGTLIAESSWQLLHRHFQADTEGVRQNREAYFSGIIDYETWIEKDILLWNSPTIEDVREGLSFFTLEPFADVTVAQLKEKGVVPCIVSSGIDILAEQVADALGIESHFVYANSFTVNNRNLEGVSRVEPRKKDEVVRHISQQLCIPLNEFAAVGDTASDITLFRNVGLKFAYNPKDQKITEAADFVIYDLREILNFC